MIRRITSAVWILAVLCLFAQGAKAQTTSIASMGQLGCTNNACMWFADISTNNLAVDGHSIFSISIFGEVATDGTLDSNSNIQIVYDVTPTNPSGSTETEPLTGTFTRCQQNCQPVVVNGDIQTPYGTVTATFSGMFNGSITFTITHHAKMNRYWHFWYTEAGTVSFQ